MYPQSMFLAKSMKNIKIFHLKIIAFTAVNNCCILHGRVFVMDIGLHVHLAKFLTLPVAFSMYLRNDCLKFFET